MNHIDLYQVYSLDRRLDSAQLGQQLTGYLDQTDPRNELVRNRIEVARAIVSDPRQRAMYDALLANPAAPLITEQTLAALAQMPAQGPVGAAVTETKKRRFNPKILAGAAAVVVVLLIAVIGIAAAAGGGGKDCSDVVFIAAAGSGQRDAEDLVTYQGVGREMYATWQALQADAQAAGKTAELRAVEYPAADVPIFAGAGVLLDKLTGGELDVTPLAPYFDDSVAPGVENATEQINDALKCNDSKIVVAGYSQGAMVMHRALHKVGPNDKIAAGLLLGDGDRLPLAMDPDLIYYVDDDVPTQSRGMAQWKPMLAVSGASQDPFPAEWNDRIASVCDDGDYVCAFSGYSINELKEITKHFNYDTSIWRSWLQEKALGAPAQG